MSNEQGCQCGQAHGACTTEFQYAVKVVCGVVVAQSGVPTPVAPGQYWTAINIHNPDNCKAANLRWKVTVASPGEPGPVSVYQNLKPLGPDRALEIDCPQIMRVLQQPPPTFVKGFVVINSDRELDVVAVYSGTPGACGSNTFGIERVQPRCVAVCEDLVLSLNTGVADWQTAAPTVGPLGPVVPIIPVGLWAPAPFGSSWVSQLFADGTSASLTKRSYELCFDLCFGFTVPAQFPIQVLADDSAEVYLNYPALVGNVPSVGYSAPHTLIVNPAVTPLHAGRNCFRVDVTNGPPPLGGPTGFALAGILRVARGKCPCSPLPMAPAQQHGPAGLASSSE